ncbi:sugar ABC transporter permease [Paludicola sp. MB14-C6]|uniref:carbohydrate ABC transporter permease n=1 Tax=Paludihabitans sp. MB14-C6 TaxID=3070656 RepID=UPI0027DC5E7A|nr:sugar ABC transporter permease [Paludicola sp. MB14-C6]WMJ23225.1 sugar ABC transporter permease [Paludicola sp. MB14-C6]
MAEKHVKRKFSTSIKESFSDIGNAFVHGDYKTKLSFIVMGFGCITRKQFIKGLLYLLLEIAYILYFICFGWNYLKNFNSLGTNVLNKVWDESQQIYINTPGDNSMLILLFSIMTIFISIGFLFTYFSNIRSAYYSQLLLKEGKKLPTFKDDFKSLFNEKFHITLLSLPALGAIVFTILPLIFMILIAFTNFDRAHQPPGNLFTWVGFNNFKDIFWQNPQKSHTFSSLLSWTLVWAFFATFSNYIFGMILALMINKKGIKLKKMWRTIFVTTIAVPSFVTLLLMSKILNDLGPLNVILIEELKWIKEPIHFLTDGNLARITVIVVNLWIGIPYTMLITTGILMNIPEDIYESARIDGAGPFKIFSKITFPYMIFVTTPYLITQFIANINNFNVIYFLTGGDPKTLDYFQAGKTDLLVTWLYKLTVNDQNYSLASTIGILVFVISAIISLITYNLSSSTKKEEQFQ